MKFVLDDESAKAPVKISLKVINSGSVEILANGIAVLWLQADGRMVRHSGNPKTLTDMGFDMDRRGRITDVCPTPED